MSIVRPLKGLLLALPMVVGFPSLAAAQSEEIVEEWVDPVPQPRGEAMFRATMMRDHNRARAAVSVAALVWDAGLAKEAAGYAATLAATRTFAHARRVAGQPVEGENLWMGTRGAYRYADMVGSWVDEGCDFRRGLFPDVSLTGSWHDIGHYTQIVWAGTRAVGCAVASNASDEYLVCRYFPAGNVMGRDVFVP